MARFLHDGMVWETTDHVTRSYPLKKALDQVETSGDPLKSVIG